MNTDEPQKSTGESVPQASIPKQAISPPPLPAPRALEKPNWILVASFVGLICICLILLILFTPSSTSQDVASTENDSGPRASTVNDNPAGQAAEDAPGPVGSQSPVNGEAIDTEALDSATQDASSQEQSEPVSKESSDDLESDHEMGDQPENAIPLTQEENPQPPEVSGNEGLTQDDPAKRRTTGQFFTLGTQKESSANESKGPAHGLAGRQGDKKQDLLRAFGGTETTEAAVKLGLEWLARNQRANGLWGLQGPFGDGGSDDNLVAASSMALLAFQGAGHTHLGDPKHPFTGVVRKGWKSLLQHLQRNQETVRFRGIHGGYTEALCTIAMCELYGMTGDRRYRKPAMEAIQYCLNAQSDQGGWRYQPRRDSDTSVTGWFLMALQSARMAKIKVPRGALEGVNQYLDAAASRDGERYAYQPGTAATRSMTAEGLLCRQYLGWRRDDPRLLAGVDYLLEQLPHWENRNVYYWYYATQVTHHLGGEPWRRWNEVMREVLPLHQVRAGKERGSWDPRGDPRGSAGGRLYVTCMSIYMLEVYYRHLPIYKQEAVGAGIQ